MPKVDLLINNNIKVISTFLSNYKFTYFISEWNRSAPPLRPLKDIEVAGEPASVGEVQDGRRRTGDEQLD
jgi:hypothetical protein